MDNSVIAKSGWLTRQSTILKKWKKSWVELYRDGHLKYYENECSPNAEDIIFVPNECLTIKSGMQVEGVQPPDGFGIHNLLSVITSSGKTWVFCGESLDDMRAWQLALEQARLFGMHAHLPTHSPAYVPAFNPGYLSTYSSDTPSVTYLPQLTYPPHPYYGFPSQQHISPGQTAFVYPYERYRHGGNDLAMGMLGGAALGSLMWGPLLWW